MATPTPEQITSVVVTLLAGSEILSLVPGIKANGWVQLILAALRGIASRKR
jgi:TRAP-type mannitol/chloroaromatic compound transport system permease large subunit